MSNSSANSTTRPVISKVCLPPRRDFNVRWPRVASGSARRFGFRFRAKVIPIGARGKHLPISDQGGRERNWQDKDHADRATHESEHTQRRIEQDASEKSAEVRGSRLD